jgi:hypothetical protein
MGEATRRKQGARGLTETPRAAPTPPEASEEAPNDAESSQDLEAAKQDLTPKTKLPAGVEEAADGTWIYDLQYDPEPKMVLDKKTNEVKYVDDGVSLPLKVKIPPKLWARNLRQASENAPNQGGVLFHLTCSVIHLSAAVVDRFDARDYAVISNRVNDIAAGND